jgi:hypothetical protein
MNLSLSDTTRSIPAEKRDKNSSRLLLFSVLLWEEFPIVSEYKKNIYIFLAHFADEVVRSRTCTQRGEIRQTKNPNIRLRNSTQECFFFSPKSFFFIFRSVFLGFGRRLREIINKTHTMSVFFYSLHKSAECRVIFIIHQKIINESKRVEELSKQHK